MDMDLASLLRATCDVVAASGRIIVEHDKKPRNVVHKGRIDLLTETDLAVEKFLKANLKDVLPKADFLAEESAEGCSAGELTWIIDPVDGTTNFAHGLPIAATSVGLWQRDRMVLGVVNVPLIGECYSAAAGLGAWLNGQPIRVSRAQTLTDSLVATGFPYSFDAELEAILARLRVVLPKTQGVRRCGVASVDLAWTACGRFEAFYETMLKPWDISAGWLLVKEAGGRVSHFDGSAQTLTGGQILATNGNVHAEMIELLAQAENMLGKR